MTQPELRQLLLAQGLPAITWQLLDVTYEICSEDFVRNNWLAWLAALPDELVLWRDVGGKRIRQAPRWMPESNDCENHALATVAWAATGNARAAALRNTPRGGIAYGLLAYDANPARAANFGVSGRHAINWFVEPLAHRVRFFEPGQGAFVELTTEERSSAWFGIAA
jgi:hypothetical protein